ncbi:hypothetical protein DIPPA_13307 [Diplonema papillatum]|nr:hypothetical protein DIPPA_13307 [Diplonema papillatum]
MHALRIVAVGVTTERMPDNYVGDSANSWSYQSTGHMLHAGEVLEAHLAPSFTMGDYIGVLLDKKYVRVSKILRFLSTRFHISSFV